MGERIQNWQEWAGSAVVALAITYYLYCQYNSKPDEPTDAPAGLAEEANGGPSEPLLSAAAAEAPISRAVPVARRNSHALDQAALACTPGSLPNLSFRGYLRPSGFNMPNVQGV